MTKHTYKTLSAAALLATISACTTSPSAAPTPSASETTKAALPMAKQADYTRVCGICHLENGEGVPGAFPPLDARLAAYATSESGRDYLAGILNNGLYGQITVNDTVYNGAMPPLASQLDTNEMAALLNYVLQTFVDTPGNYSAIEVERRLASVGSTSGATLRKNANAASK